MDSKPWNGAAKAFVFGAGCLAAWCPPVNAGDVYFGPSAYFASPDSGLHAKSDVGAQLTLGYRFNPTLGFEVLSETNRFKLDDGTGTIKQRGVSAQGLYHFLIPDEQVSPFVSVGGGWLHSASGGHHDNSPLIRGGVGLNWDLPDSPISFKADATFRHVFGNDAVPFYATQNPTDRIYTVGMQYSFGHDAERPYSQSTAPQYPVPPEQPASNPQAATIRPNNCTVTSRTTCSGPPDQDGDGIPDADDKCPDTPPNAVVDADGCLLYLRKGASG